MQKDFKLQRGSHPYSHYIIPADIGILFKLNMKIFLLVLTLSILCRNSVQLFLLVRNKP